MARIFVGGLPWCATHEDVWAWCQYHEAPVVAVQLVRKHQDATLISGFLTCANDRQRTLAISMLPRRFWGHYLTIGPAKPQETPRSSTAGVQVKQAARPPRPPPERQPTRAATSTSEKQGEKKTEPVQPASPEGTKGGQKKAKAKPLVEPTKTEHKEGEAKVKAEMPAKQWESETEEPPVLENLEPELAPKLESASKEEEAETPYLQASHLLSPTEVASDKTCSPDYDPFETVPATHEEPEAPTLLHDGLESLSPTSLAETLGSNGRRSHR